MWKQGTLCPCSLFYEAECLNSLTVTREGRELQIAVSFLTEKIQPPHTEKAPVKRPEPEMVGSPKSVAQ